MARPWMPLYVADYLADTGHLRTIEHGAYLLLIMHYWQHGVLPTDETQLARIARLGKAEWAASRETLAALFREGWMHKRIDVELNRAAAFRQKQALNGSKGGRPRNPTETQNKPNGNPDYNPTETQTKARARVSQSQSQSSDKESEDILSADFENWYAAYPKHVGRGQAAKAYRAARKKADAATLLAAAKESARRYATTAPEYIPHASTWLNGERWLDQDAAPEPGPNNPYASIPG